MSGLQSDLRSGVLILQKHDPFMQRLVRCTLVKLGSKFVVSHLWWKGAVKHDSINQKSSCRI